MNRILIVGFAAIALVLSANAAAGNNNGPIFGDEVTNNYNTTNNHGGNATAAAGAVAGAAAGAISGSYSGVGDISNTNVNTALGGAGGRGGDGGNAAAFGGNASQGQIGINKQSLDAKQNTAVDASSANDNRSTASGNATNVSVGGDVYEAKRNAPGIVGGNVFPTASCKGGFSIGGSGPAGGGLLNIAITDKDCVAVLLAQTFQSFGDQITACELVKSTKAYARQVKRNPNIKAVCKAAQ